MKLIDLLLRELPKRGGWPDGAEAVVQDADDMEFYFYTGGPVVNTGKSWWFKDNVDGSTWIFYEGKFEVADDHDTTTITRDQYEAALAASQKVEWSGDGLPPVGCECEWQDKNTKQWQPVKVVYASEWVTVIREINKEKGNDLAEIAIENYGDDARLKFRQIRSEADKKRDDAIEKITDAICGEIPDTGMATAANYAARAYDSIAAGKIPGVKLED